MLRFSPKSLVDLCRDAFAAWTKRRNLARAQAQRLLDAVAAHGVADVQIPRLLPEALALPNAVFADADESVYPQIAHAPGTRSTITERRNQWAAAPGQELSLKCAL